MQKEIEVKFLGVDVEKIQETLRKHNARHIQERTAMKRYVFDNPINPQSYLRVRNEGNKTTLTYKEIDSFDAIDGIRELELEVSDFEGMKNLLYRLGMYEKSYQETFRETRELDNVVITIDERPGLNPFIEIEGDLQSIHDMVTKLDYSLKDAVYGTVTNVYQTELGLDPDYINEYKHLTFSNPPQKI